MGVWSPFVFNSASTTWNPLPPSLNPAHATSQETVEKFSGELEEAWHTNTNLCLEAKDILLLGDETKEADDRTIY